MRTPAEGFPLLRCPFQARSRANSYVPPTAVVHPSANIKEYQADFDSTWRALVAYLSEQAFAIDTIEKDSGLVTISFSLSDPRKDLDCGQMAAWVKNLRGRRDYAFDGASPREHYEVVEKDTLIPVERTLQVSGKINVFVTPPRDSASRVKVVTRYVVTKNVKMSPVMFDSNFRRLPPFTQVEVASFNTGEEGRYAQGRSSCRARGTLEATLLDGISTALGSP